MGPVTELPANVVSALSRGRKVEAIRLLRESGGMDLEDAKDTVEEYARSRPELGARTEATSRQDVARLLRWLAVGVAMAVMWFWLRR